MSRGTSAVTAINANSRTVVFADNCRISGGSIGVFLDNSSRFQGVQATVAGAGGAGIFFATSANQCTLTDCSISALDSAIDMTAGGAANVFNTSFNSTAASGFCIAGTGNLTYCNIINNGTAIALDPAIGVITVSDWKPYAEAGAAPGTGVVKGTCSFDSSQFNLTDGFVQGNFSGLFPWVDYAAPAIVPSNSGANDTVGTTLTLPAAPQNGEVCSFLTSVVGSTVIQASGAQVIAINNGFSSAGGTATSLAQGDSVTLAYMASSDTWWSIGTALGIWTLA